MLARLRNDWHVGADRVRCRRTSVPRTAQRALRTTRLRTTRCTTGTGTTEPAQRAFGKRDSLLHIENGLAITLLRVPNGLAFSPDYKKLYVCDTGITHYPNAKNVVWQYDVDGGKLSNAKPLIDMTLDGKSGFPDGLRVDTEGNIWVGAGWVGPGYDGVQVFAPNDGARIGQILLPETCANLCFGGRKRNRLFMTASQSLYSVYVETQGAHFC